MTDKARAGEGLREAAEAVDAAWFVVEMDEGRDEVRLRYASDLPARLNALRAALAIDVAPTYWICQICGKRFPAEGNVDHLHGVLP